MAYTMEQLVKAVDQVVAEYTLRVSFDVEYSVRDNTLRVTHLGDEKILDALQKAIEAQGASTVIRYKCFLFISFY